MGSLGDSAGNTNVRLLAELWNGATWKVQTVPSPITPSPGVNSMSFSAVECLSPASCLALGSYSAGGGAGGLLIEKWNGTRWTIQPAPTHALGDIACQSATSCFAVGAKPTSKEFFFNDVEIEHWDGRRWTTQATPSVPPPAGSEGGSSLAAISCPGPTFCTAVGTLEFDDGAPDTIEYATIALRWDGTRWTRQPSPGATNQSQNLLYDVSCISANNCTAVGVSAFDANSFPGSALIMGWNGTRWALQRAAVPSGDVGGALIGIDCATVCTGVGLRFDRNFTQRSLAETNEAFS